MFIPLEWPKSQKADIESMPLQGSAPTGSSNIAASSHKDKNSSLSLFL